MRLFSLAVVAGLLAVGFTYAADEKKPEVKKPADEKKAEKAARVVGSLTKIDGMKLTVTTKGDGGEKATEYTVTDKTKFFQEEAAAPAKDGDKPVEKKPEEKKPEVKKPADGEKKPEVKKPAAKRTEIKLADLKTGARVAVMAGEDKVATEVVVLPAAPKKGDK